MSLETATKNEEVASARCPGIIEPEREDDPLQTLAIDRIYQLRKFKLHLVVFAFGLPILGGVWILTEYFEEHTWPSRFASAPDVAGTWDPWFFFAAGIWAIILAIHALRTFFGPPVGPIGRYIRRPIRAAELDREIERLKSSQ